METEQLSCFSLYASTRDVTAQREWQIGTDATVGQFQGMVGTRMNQLCLPQLVLDSIN